MRIKMAGISKEVSAILHTWYHKSKLVSFHFEDKVGSRQLKELSIFLIIVGYVLAI